MKVLVKAPFFDERGIHKKGDIVDVEAKKFRPEYMEPIEEKKTEKVEKAIKTDSKKTTRKKG